MRLPHPSAAVSLLRLCRREGDVGEVEDVFPPPPPIPKARRLRSTQQSIRMPLRTNLPLSATGKHTACVTACGIRQHMSASSQLQTSFLDPGPGLTPGLGVPCCFWSFCSCLGKTWDPPPPPPPFFYCALKVKLNYRPRHGPPLGLCKILHTVTRAPPHLVMLSQFIN